MSLHLCAPKNMGAEEWAKSYRETIYTVHQTCNHLFRAVVETWESIDPGVKHTPGAQDSSLVGDDSENPLTTPAWHGVLGGSQRLRSLIRLLSKFVTVTTQSTVSISVGALLDLTARLINVFAPPANAPGSISLRPEIGKEEKEALWCELPVIHAEVLHLLRSVVTSFGTGSISICQTCLDQLLWVFELDRENEQVRNVAYALLDEILPVFGHSMTKGNVVSLTPILKNACYDVLPLSTARSYNGISQQNSANKSAANATNADSYLAPLPSKENAAPKSTVFRSQLGDTAERLLTHALAHLPTEYLPTSLRAEIDRTAVIGGRHSIMLASVLNPVTNNAGQQTAPSLLPFLARLSSDVPEIEGLLRPRMPVILGAPGAFDRENEDETEVDEGGKDSHQVLAGNMTMNVTENVFPPPMADTKKRSSPVAEVSQSEDTQTKRQRVEKDVPPPPPIEQNQPLPETAAVSSITTTQTTTTTSTTPPTHNVHVDRTVQHERPSANIEDEPTEKTDIPADTRTDFQPIEVSVPASQTLTNIAASPQVQQEGQEDSDEEIPTLNVESDSDEEISDG